MSALCRCDRRIREAGKPEHMEPAVKLTLRHALLWRRRSAPCGSPILLIPFHLKTS
jgi:hypothetical protein